MLSRAIKLATFNYMGPLIVFKSLMKISFIRKNNATILHYAGYAGYASYVSYVSYYAYR